MKELDSMGVTNLVCAIVKKAVQDWRLAQRRLKRNPDSRQAKWIVDDCERFFKSEYFEHLTGMDGKEFLQRLKDAER